ncbi:MAG: hypothetical protein MPW16_01975 [Candidatus Manganitrophus sp.]|nr:MAG: hypothetical protein MPW16_01975 [Candidatus Manganitrophus sp.]
MQLKSRFSFLESISFMGKTEEANHQVRDLRIFVQRSFRNNSWKKNKRGKHTPQVAVLIENDVYEFKEGHGTLPIRVMCI